MITCTVQATTSVTLSIKWCYHSTSRSTVPDHWGEKIKNAYDRRLSTCLWEWEAFSLSAALRTNIWPAGGRRIKDKDISRGHERPKGPMWDLEGPQRKLFFLGIKLSREQKLAQKAYGSIFLKAHCLHTLQWKRQELNPTHCIKINPHLKWF